VPLNPQNIKKHMNCTSIMFTASLIPKKEQTPMNNLIWNFMCLMKIDESNIVRGFSTYFIFHIHLFVFHLLFIFFEYKLTEESINIFFIIHVYSLNGKN